jgi:hypothetical protein
MLFIAILVSFLLFNDKGNDLSKPELERLINERLSEGKVVVEQFALDLDEVRATLRYNKSSTLEVRGSYSLLMQNFDLDYTLALKDFNYKNIAFKEQVDAKGHASGSYDLSSHDLNILYDINISDLTKLQTMTKKKLYGSMLLNGEVKKEKDNTSITGRTEDLEGELNFQFKDSHFSMQMDGLSMEKIMQMLHYPSLVQSTIKGEAEYNLVVKKGQLRSTLIDAKLLPNNFTKLVKNFNGLDLSKEVFKESNLTASIGKEKIDFDFLAKNSKTLIKISPAFIVSAQNTIDAHYIVEVEGKDVGGKIKGNLESPHISIDSSKFIQSELNKVIDQNSDKLKEFGIGEKEQEKVKDFFNKLFH